MFVADGLEHSRVKTKDCGHGAGLCIAGFLHQAAALTHEADTVIEADGAGGDQRGVLAERVAGDEGWARGDCASLDCGRECGDRVGDDGWLRVDGAGQFILGALEADLGERDAQRLVSRGEDRTGGGGLIGEVGAHADVLSTLAGEDPGDGGIEGQILDGGIRHSCHRVARVRLPRLVLTRAELEIFLDRASLAVSFAACGVVDLPATGGWVANQVRHRNSVVAAARIALGLGRPTLGKRHLFPPRAVGPRAQPARTIGQWCR